MIKKCEFCGDRFNALRISEKYCSKRCANHASENRKKLNEEPLIKTCPICGKDFVAKGKHQKYCSVSCSMENDRMRKWESRQALLRGERKPYVCATDTLCWSCKKVTRSGCSWAKNHTPVEGWNAKKTKKAKIESYRVIECPEYEEG